MSDTPPPLSEPAAQPPPDVYRTVFDVIAEGLLVTTDDHQVVAYNHSALEIFGLSGEHVLAWQHNPPVALLGPDGKEMPRDQWPSSVTFRSGKGLQGQVYQVRRPDGISVWVSISSRLLPVLPGQRPSALLSYLDITQRLAAERAVRASEARLQHVIDASSDGVWELDRKTMQFRWSRGMYQLLGLDPALHDPSKRPALELVHPDDRERYVAAARAHIASGEPMSIEIRMRHADGRYRWLSSRGQAIRDAAGRMETMIGTVSDITAQIEAQQAIAEARDAAEAANRAKDHFLAILSHELRTPLTPVLLLAESFSKDASLPREAADAFEMIREQVEQEKRLIDDLLDLTRIDRGKFTIAPERTDLNQLLEQTIDAQRMCFSAAGLLPEVSLLERPVWADADPGRIRQVLRVLLENACKFTPSGGMVYVRLTTAVESAMVEVRDTGIGIEPELLPRLFNPFEQGDQTITRMYGGLGLGLVIARSIAEMHGGTLSAESAGRNRGTTMRLVLRLATGDQAASSGDDSSRQPLTVRRRILLVEDHEPTRLALSKTLSDAGYDMTVAPDFESAVAFAPKGFDVLIADINLPDRSGWELPSVIAPGGSRPAVSVSGMGTDADILHSRQCGFAAHLVKPLPLQKLIATIEQLASGMG